MRPSAPGRALLIAEPASSSDACAIVRALRAGNTVKASVEAFGVSYRTAASWIQDGEAHAEGWPSLAQRKNLGAKADEVAIPPCGGMDELTEDGNVVRHCTSGQHQYLQFQHAVVRARAEAQLILVGKLGTAATAGNATAALAMLRQLAPEEWGETRKVRVEGGGPAVGTGPPLIIEIEHSDRDPRELEEIMRELEADD